MIMSIYRLNGMDIPFSGPKILNSTLNLAILNRPLDLYASFSYSQKSRIDCHNHCAKRHKPCTHCRREENSIGVKDTGSKRNGNGDQCHHAGLFLPELIKEALEERPAAVKEDHRGKRPQHISVTRKTSVFLKPKKDWIIGDSASIGAVKGQ
jgi:hypothetical protein